MRGVYAATIMTFMTNDVLGAWQQRISGPIYELIRIYSLAPDTDTLRAFLSELSASVLRRSSFIQDARELIDGLALGFK